MVRRFGAEVRAWCDDVPRVAGELAARWGLSELAPVAAGGTLRVVACQTDGARAFLKLTPRRGLAIDEAVALRAWQDGGRAPRVFATDEPAGALLLEAIEPGTRLSEVPQAATVDAVAALMAALHVPAPAGLPALRERVDFVFDITRARARGTRLPADAIERSHAAGRALADERRGPDVLVHGDLHLSNVLIGPPGRELVAIDPRACAGDPAFDLVDWITDCAPPDRWADAPMPSPLRPPSRRCASGAGCALWPWSSRPRATTTSPTACSRSPLRRRRSRCPRAARGSRRSSGSGAGRAP
jgi:streptomycin 6-kinase